MIGSNLTFSLLDTSQLARLLDTGKIKKLDSVEFVSQHGFPLLTAHQLLELTDLDNYESYVGRVRALGLVSNFYTMEVYENGLPGSIQDLFTWELKTISENPGIEAADIVEELRRKTKPFTLRWPDDALRILYETGRKLAATTRHVSTLGIGDDRGFSATKVKDLHEFIFNLDNPDAKRTLFDEYFQMLQSRRVASDQVPNLVNGFDKEFHGPFLQSWNQKSVLELLEHMIGRKADPEKTFGFYKKEIPFQIVRSICHRRFGIPMAQLQKVSLEATLIGRAHAIIEAELISGIQKDGRRPLETSNTSDLYLLCYSLIYQVHVDRRTFDLAKRIDRKHQLGMNIVKSSYSVSD